MAKQPKFVTRLRVLFCLLFFFLSSVILMAVFVWMSQSSQPPKTCPTNSTHNKWMPNHKAIEIFSDLSPAELTAVHKFLLNQKPLNIVPVTKATIQNNYIYMIELHNPTKREALNYLDHGGPKPERVAKAVVFRGADSSVSVAEYLVGPIPNPRWYNQYHPSTRKRTINFCSRPTSMPEYKPLYIKLIPSIMDKIEHVLKESYGYWFHNCGDKCLIAADVPIRGLESNQRHSWIQLLRKVEGFYLQPVSLEILIDHNSTNPDDWSVMKVNYYGQFFDSIEEFVRKYDEGTVNKVKQLDSNEKAAAYDRRGAFRADTPQAGPRQYEPEGHRYRVDGNFVQYMPWTFAFRISFTGLQLFDIKYNDERLVYEMSLQEAVSFYAGNTPIGMQVKAIDTGWSFGADNFELVRGIDCPESATFLDTYHFVDADKPTKYPNSICIFEHNTGMPLRRHTDNNSNNGYTFYGGLVNYVLVIRTINVVYNYDYVIDYIFYQNGVIETKTQATGYLQTSYLFGDGTKYGTRISDHVLGNLHTHIFNYKVDVDLGGTENNFQTASLQLENIPIPWETGRTKMQPTLHHSHKRTETEAAFKYDSQLPYLVFVNSKSKNKWGHPRGYRIQLTSHAKPLLPDDCEEEKAAAWSRYQMAVTKYKETERYSTSIYNQNDPWDPAVYFPDFVNDDENIVNEDLVAWVTVGFVHIPHSEDVPNTATSGNSVGFFFRPFNFFDEDPSVASRDIVILRPGPHSSGKPVVSWWTDQSPTEPSVCLSNIQPLSYNGTCTPV
ncbi:diamine oxidase [copper-containing]-like [Lampetra planeri]